MIDVTVKTLDSQNHVFSVEEEMTVREFKEKIQPNVAIPVDQQRLIFRGRVLQDDKKLSEYNVANNTIHVVQRPANQNSTSNDEPPTRPSSQAGGRLGDGGGIFITADDGTGAGRNAIIMGAIGLPTFDVEGHPGGEDGPQPRRSGAQVRLMVGNQMLNRASTLLQRLEDDDVTTTATSTTTSSSSPSSGSASASGEQASPDQEVDPLLNDGSMEVDDDQASIERMISQVVNVSSAAALVAAVRQVQQPGAPGVAGLNLPTTASSVSGAAAAPPPQQQQSTNSENAQPVPDTQARTSSSSAGAPTSGHVPVVGTSPTTPVRRPESPRIRELSIALQDYLALQDRLSPFLRYLQEALRENRVYTEAGEGESTQFVYNTVSSILHLLSHSLHAFSEILCDFSLPPDDRRLTASSSILVEQSTVVRATIPVAVPAAAMLNAGTVPMAGVNNQQNGTPASSQQQAQGAQLPTGISISMGPPPNPGRPMTGMTGIPGLPGVAISMSAAPGMPLGMSIPGFIPGSMPSQQGHQHQWINPNATSSGANESGRQQPPTQSSTTNSNDQQQTAANATGAPGAPGALPAGLQNLGALLGAGGAAGLANILGGAVPAGFQNPFLNMLNPQQPGSNNNNSTGTPNQQQQSPRQNAGQQPAATATGGTGGNAGSTTNRTGGTGNVGNHGGATLQNLLRNELNRPQFDVLLPCHTHHSSGRSHLNRNRPAEFRRFVDLEKVPTAAGTVEGETVDLLVDFIRNSSLIDLLQPALKDVLLNYLMRGRDAKNPAHVKTCAKGLAKKILPFLERFTRHVGGCNRAVDIPTTYTNVFTEFLTNLIQKILGQSSGGDFGFKVEFFKLLTELQKHLIQIFKICYPSSANVGLGFVNYLVEYFMGGTSILFKNQVRQKLIEHLKKVESKTDCSSASADAFTFIVYHEAVVQPPVAAAPTVEAPQATSSSINAGPNATTARDVNRSRCAASFGESLSSSTPSAGTGTPMSVTSSGGSTPCKVPCTVPPPVQQVVANTTGNNYITDDVDIDEVLQMPSSMAASSVSGNSQDAEPTAESRPCRHGANAQGLANHQSDSIVSLLRSLPSEWADIVQQDVRRQMEMPAQPAFSPGYNTLFPRKH